MSHMTLDWRIRKKSKSEITLEKMALIPFDKKVVQQTKQQTHRLSLLVGNESTVCTGSFRFKPKGSQRLLWNFIMDMKGLE